MTLLCIILSACQRIYTLLTKDYSLSLIFWEKLLIMIWWSTQRSLTGKIIVSKILFQQVLRIYLNWYFILSILITLQRLTIMIFYPFLFLWLLYIINSSLGSVSLHCLNLSIAVHGFFILSFCKKELLINLLWFLAKRAVIATRFSRNWFYLRKLVIRCDIFNILWPWLCIFYYSLMFGEIIFRYYVFILFVRKKWLSSCPYLSWNYTIIRHSLSRCLLSLG